MNGIRVSQQTYKCNKSNQVFLIGPGEKYVYICKTQQGKRAESSDLLQRGDSSAPLGQSGVLSHTVVRLMHRLWPGHCHSSWDSGRAAWDSPFRRSGPGSRCRRRRSSCAARSCRCRSGRRRRGRCAGRRRGARRCRPRSLGGRRTPSWTAGSSRPTGTGTRSRGGTCRAAWWLGWRVATGRRVKKRIQPPADSRLCDNRPRHSRQSRSSERSLQSKTPSHR